MGPSNQIDTLGLAPSFNVIEACMRLSPSLESLRPGPAGSSTPEKGPRGNATAVNISLTAGSIVRTTSATPSAPSEAICDAAAAIAVVPGEERAIASVDFCPTLPPTARYVEPVALPIRGSKL